MKDFYVICDNIRSLENIGSIFRTADAIGVTKIYLCGISGSPPTNFGLKPGSTEINPKLYSKLVGGRPPHQKITKTALGAEKTVPFEYYRQIGRLVEKLRKKKVFIISLEQDKKAIDYRNLFKTLPAGRQVKFPLALVIGNEVRGISKKILKKSDKIVYLPMKGEKESLNVAVAFGIMGYYISNFHK